jgi:hypothetical protein
MMPTMSSTVQEFGSFTTILLMSIDCSSIDGCVAHTYKYMAVTLIMLLCCWGALQPAMCSTHRGQCMKLWSCHMYVASHQQVNRLAFRMEVSKITSRWASPSYITPTPQLIWPVSPVCLLADVATSARRYTGDTGQISWGVAFCCIDAW